MWWRSSRLDRIEQNIEKMGHQMQEMGHQVQELGHQVQGLGHQVQGLGHQVQEMGHQMQGMQQNIEDLAEISAATNRRTDRFVEEMRESNKKHEERTEQLQRAMEYLLSKDG